MSQDANLKPRLVSLDQFRGYTIAGMFLVNFIGGFAVSPFLFRHHYTFCSYADTIMPHFLFAVGFAFRLSFGRRELKPGASAGYGRVVRRLVGLGLVGLFIFQMDDRLDPRYWIDLVSRQAWNEVWRPFGKNWMQTLFQIATATCWVVPVIRARARWRVLWLVASAALHVLISHYFYYAWMYEPGQGHTGGPLGFLTWCIPTLVGTFACDWALDGVGKGRIGRMFAWSLVLMAIGYVMSCGTRWYDVPADETTADAVGETASNPVIPTAKQFDSWQQHIQRGEWSSVVAEPPFVPPPDTGHRKWNYWMMSVKPGTLSFMTFNAGFSMFVYMLFYLACDGGGLQLGLFRTLGRNSLAGYLIQWPTDDIFTKLIERTSARWGPSLGFPPDAVGRNAPVVFVLVGFAVYFAVNWLILWAMERKKIFLKV